MVCLLLYEILTYDEQKMKKSKRFRTVSKFLNYILGRVSDDFYKTNKKQKPRSVSVVNNTRCLVSDPCNGNRIRISSLPL